MLKFAVIRQHPVVYFRVLVQSRHRTIEAAERAAEKVSRSFRSQGGFCPGLRVVTMEELAELHSDD